VTAPAAGTARGVSWRPRVRPAVVHSTALAVTCLVTYTLTTELLGRVHFVSAGDTLLGGLWAVIAAAFVYHATIGAAAGVAAAWTGLHLAAISDRDRAGTIAG